MFDGQGRSEGSGEECVSFQLTNSPPPLKQKWHKKKSIFPGYKNNTSSNILAVGVMASLSWRSVVGIKEK